MSWSISPVCGYHAWDVSISWCRVSWMLSLCTRSLPNCWVMAPNPRDETVHLARLGAPLELELVDRRLGACRAHSSMLALCHDKPSASCWYGYCGCCGGGVGAASLLALLLVILLGKQKWYAYSPLLAEREGWLANDNYTNGTPHWVAKSHLYSQRRRKSESHPGLSWVCDLESNRPVDIHAVTLNERNEIPL